MLLSTLNVTVGRRAAQGGRHTIRVANDNPSREQILFEKCVQRELGGTGVDGGKSICRDQGKADPLS
ncbi:hypothetical protein C8024_14430 [Sphingopyxis sp. BSNA05]|uniref:hypothetical protein n=1 Tax=Sphingopyxis sp. BSNA05 TaxID=1236614 RepID=UPI001C253E32|nr:hypothetical protein [Sphingopyxis sp. BSNA05]NRD90402.1 hypothetical protein [Sphingopyxis sp. BSNA05]